MAFNIDTFRAEVTGRGTIQTNKFEVLIPLPKSLGATNVYTSQMLTMRAENVKFPGVNLDLTSVNRYGYGPRQRMPFNVNFNDNSITFIEDEQNTVSKLFYLWMNSIFDYTGIDDLSMSSIPSYFLRYKNEYATDISIYVYDNIGNLSCTAVMKEAYPTNLGDVNLSWGETNNLFRVNVGFTFKEWYISQFVQKGTSIDPSSKSPTVSNSVQIPPAQQMNATGNVPGGAPT